MKKFVKNNCLCGQGLMLIFFHHLLREMAQQKLDPRFLKMLLCHDDIWGSLAVKPRPAFHIQIQIKGIRFCIRLVYWSVRLCHVSHVLLLRILSKLFSHSLGQLLFIAISKSIIRLVFVLCGQIHVEGRSLSVSTCTLVSKTFEETTPPRPLKCFWGLHIPHMCCTISLVTAMIWEIYRLQWSGPINYSPCGLKDCQDMYSLQSKHFSCTQPLCVHCV